MDVRYGDPELERMATVREYRGGFETQVVHEFRALIQAIKSAVTLKDLQAMLFYEMTELNGMRPALATLSLCGDFRVTCSFDDQSVTVRTLAATIKRG